MKTKSIKNERSFYFLIDKDFELFYSYLKTREINYMSILYLIRHAQASFGKADYDRLSETGIRQSQILADHLLVLGHEFDAIYSGAQLRHEQTLAPFLEALANSNKIIPLVHSTDAFNEYDSENILKTLIPEVIRKEPEFEKDAAAMLQSRQAFQKVYEQIMRLWMKQEAPFRNLETWKTYSKRVHTGLQTIISSAGSGKKIALVTSGGPISVCVQKALCLSNENTLQLTWQIMNASVTRLIFSGNRLMLSGFNDVGHLELKKDSHLITYR
jgi:broad specificity phosphatase PhoE